MPVYEYVCNKCHKEFEVVRPISKSGKTTVCPKCKSEDVERHWSRVFVETSRKS